MIEIPFSFILCTNFSTRRLASLQKEREVGSASRYLVRVRVPRMRERENTSRRGEGMEQRGRTGTENQLGTTIWGTGESSSTPTPTAALA